MCLPWGPGTTTDIFVQHQPSSGLSYDHVAMSANACIAAARHFGCSPQDCSILAFAKQLQKRSLWLCLSAFHSHDTCLSSIWASLNFTCLQQRRTLPLPQQLPHRGRFCLHKHSKAECKHRTRSPFGTCVDVTELHCS